VITRNTDEKPLSCQ